MAIPDKINAINYNKINGLSVQERGQLAALDSAPKNGVLSAAELSRALIANVYNAPLSALFHTALAKTSPQRQTVIALFRDFQPALQIRMLLQVSSFRQRELLLSLIDPNSPDPLRDLIYVLHQLPTVDDGMWGALIFAGLRKKNPELVTATQEAVLSDSYGDERVRLRAYWQKSEHLPEIRSLDSKSIDGSVAMGYFPNTEAAALYMRRHRYPVMSVPGIWTERYALHMAGRAVGVVLVVYDGQAHLVMPKRGYQPAMLAQAPHELPPKELPQAISATTQSRIKTLYNEGHILASGDTLNHQAALEKFNEIGILNPAELSADYFAARELQSLGDHEGARQRREEAVFGWNTFLKYNPQYFATHSEEQVLYDNAKLLLEVPDDE